MDDAKNIAGGDSFERGWYDFPCKVNLNEGENTIKVTMTGGWKHTFYSFGLQTAGKTVDAPKTVTFNYDASLVDVKVFKDKTWEVEESA